MLDSIAGFAGLLDAEGNVLDISRSAIAAAGIAFSDVQDKPFSVNFWWQISDEAGRALKDALRRAKTGETIRWQTEIGPNGLDGTVLALEMLLTPVKNEDGNISFIAFEISDLTQFRCLERENERLRRQLDALRSGIVDTDAVTDPMALPRGTWQDTVAALKESEERFRAFVTASSDVVYRMSADWLEMRHLEGKDFIPTTVEPDQTWLTKYIHPDDQPEVTATIERAIRTKSIFELEHRVLRVDGTLGWTFSRAIPLFDKSGEILEWFGAASDVTQRKRHEQHQRMLLDELNHRVKNTLATVQSMAKQTLRNASNLNESREAFDARLIALSKAHNVLTREQWEGAELREIVRDALAAYVSGAHEHSIRVDGPGLRLQPKAALALSMALHELATNAVKYGALTVAGGMVEVGWRIDEESGYFYLRWVEKRGPPVAIPLKRGFGSRLIEQGLAQDLYGNVKLEFAQGGVICSIEAPLDELRVQHEEPQRPDSFSLNIRGM